MRFIKYMIYDNQVTVLWQCADGSVFAISGERVTNWIEGR